MGLYNYNHGYRDYKPETARFTTVDPVRDGANWFAYVNNDPVNWVDPDGRKPGDVFSTVDATANDFGKEFNGKSINEKREYGTTIVRKGEGYTYMEPSIGTVARVTLPTPLGGPSEVVASAHTYSNYDPVVGERVVNTDMPSDPNDPARKNKIDPPKSGKNS
jgi:hypothetical protein